MAYCCFIGIHLQNVAPLIAISFFQFLVENNLSHSAISNHVSAVKANLALHGLPSYSFQEPRIAYFQRSLSLHKTFSPIVKKIIDIPLLTAIISICDTMWVGQIFKALYLSFHFYKSQIQFPIQSKRFHQSNKCQEVMYSSLLQAFIFSSSGARPCKHGTQLEC